MQAEAINDLRERIAAKYAQPSFAMVSDAAAYDDSNEIANNADKEGEELEEENEGFSTGAIFCDEDYWKFV